MSRLRLAESAASLCQFSSRAVISARSVGCVGTGSGCATFPTDGAIGLGHDSVGATGSQRQERRQVLCARLEAKSLEGFEMLVQAVAPDARKSGEWETLPDIARGYPSDYAVAACRVSSVCEVRMDQPALTGRP